jgi:hypothetical protein
VATPPSPLPSQLLLVAIIALGLTALYFGVVRPHVSSIPKSISDPMADIKPPPLPPIEMPALEVPPVPTLEPPLFKAAPLIEPGFKSSGPMKPGGAEEKDLPKPTS